MQRLMFVEGPDKEKFSEINAMLEQGWRVIEIHSSKPSGDDYIHAIVLLEKMQCAEEDK